MLPRFTLTHTLMGMALIAIFLAFLRSEGCGSRFTRVNALSFAPDDSRIAVSMVAARDARVPLKGYLANVSRTLSWLDSRSGATLGTFHEAFKPGNCGPAFHFRRPGTNQMQFGPDGNAVTVVEFGGGNVTQNGDSPVDGALPLRTLAVEYSRSGRLMAASGVQEISVLDTQKNATVMNIAPVDLVFLFFDRRLSFTDDDRQLIVAGMTGLQVWDIDQSALTKTILQKHHVRDFAMVPGDTVVVCSEHGVRRYDLQGNLVTAYSTEDDAECTISRDGSILAIRFEDTVQIIDLSTDKPINMFPHVRTSTAALSSDGSVIALGFADRVELYDTRIRRRRWVATPPSRYRWPWTVPAIALVAWFPFARRLYRLSQPDKTPRILPPASSY